MAALSAQTSIAANTIFMEKDHDKTSHWFDLKPDELLQGLLTVQNNIPRVYVVTTDTPEEYSYIHDRWPRVIQKIVETGLQTYR